MFELLFCPIHGLPALLSWLFFGTDASMIGFMIRYSITRVVEFFK